MDTDNREKKKTKVFEVYVDMNYESIHVRVDYYPCKTASMDELSKSLAISIESPNQPTEVFVKAGCKSITICVNPSGQMGAPPCMCCSPTAFKSSVGDEPYNEGASRKSVKDRILGLRGKISHGAQFVSSLVTILQFVARYLSSLPWTC